MSELPPADRIERAHAAVSRLCKGEDRWRMSIPANRETDHDLLISDGLMAGTEALKRIAELEQLLEDALALVIVAEPPRSRGVQGQVVGMTWLDRFTTNRFRLLDAAGITSNEHVKDLMSRVKDREENS